MVRDWSGDDTSYDELRAERGATGGPAVQDAEAMQSGLLGSPAQRSDNGKS